MCKYCETGASICSQHDDYPASHVKLAVDGDMLRFDYYNIEASYRIDYCPICGRKLLESSLKGANKYEYQ